MGALGGTEVDELVADTLTAPETRERVNLPRWRVTTWLLAGWCVLSVAWIVAARLPLFFCPYGQQGCATKPIISTGQTGLAVLGAAAGAAVLLLVRRWEGRQREAVEVPAPARTVRRRWLVIGSLVGVAVSAHLLLFAPMISDPFCAKPIHLNGAMAYPLNCDSIEFMRLAHHPRGILTFHNPRQSRPAYVATGAVLTRTVGPVAKALGLDRLYGQTDSAYLPLVLINLLVAAAAIAMLVWLLARMGTPPLATIPLAGLLAVNGVTKAFDWTPHQQTFALFVPVVSIVIGRWLILDRPSWLPVCLLGLGTGIASLYYGSFLITAGVVVLILLAQRWRGVLLSGAMLGSFAAPQLAWILICDKVTGGYYNQEAVVYHEFVWLPQFARQGLHPFGRAVVTMAAVTVRELVTVGGVALLLILCAALLAVRMRVRLTAQTPQQRAILIASALTVVVSVVFAFAIGIIAARLMFHAVPGLLIIAGWMVSRVSVKSTAAARIGTAGLAVAFLAVLAVELTTHGPYS
jgi:hypothetical protein